MPGSLQWKARSLSAADKLLAAGAELFSSHGYSATTVEAIARRAGVNKALVSYHFRGKRGLYLAVRNEILEFLMKTVAGRPQASIHGQKAQFLLERLSLALTKRPLVARSVLRETLGDGPPPEDGITILEHLADRLAKTAPAGTPAAGHDSHVSRQNARSALVMILDQAAQGGDAAALKRLHPAILTVLAASPAQGARRHPATTTGNRSCLPVRPPGSLI